MTVKDKSQVDEAVLLMAREGFVSTKTVLAHFGIELPATPPMTTEAALLAAIAIYPDDDTPRLELADHYDSECDPPRPDDACAQRLAVALRRVIETPGEDGPRIEYAEILERYAEERVCPACGGRSQIEVGKAALLRFAEMDSVPSNQRRQMTYETAGRMLSFAEYRASLQATVDSLIDRGLGAECDRCGGSGRVSDGRRERAEFIRVQVEAESIARFAKNGHPVGLRNRRAKALCEREAAISGRHNGTIFLGMLVPVAGLEAFANSGTEHGWLVSGRPSRQIRASFSRGFVRWVYCVAADWLAHGPAIMKAQPVEEVRLTDLAPRQAETRLSNGRVELWWLWESDATTQRLGGGSVLRDDLWHELPSLPESYIHRNYKVYRTPADADAALSVAAIGVAKIWAETGRTDSFAGIRANLQRLRDARPSQDQT